MYMMSTLFFLHNIIFIITFINIAVRNVSNKKLMGYIILNYIRLSKLNAINYINHF